MGGRESLLADLDRLLAEQDGPTVAIVTHHLEELPVGIRRVALVRAGRLMAAGGTAQTLDDRLVSATFGVEVAVRAHAGRYTATVRRDAPTSSV
jgi:iron complex transport system ATP-binding protein